jgi:hypothetical protein
MYSRLSWTDLKIGRAWRGGLLIYDFFDKVYGADSSRNLAGGSNDVRRDDRLEG